MRQLLLTLFLVIAALWASAATEVYLVNVGPGRDIYELDGHSAIAIKDDTLGQWAINYGVFDFDSPNFVGRFVKGETDYMCVIYPLNAFLNSYHATGRHIQADRIAMDSVQTARLMEVIRHDLAPANRVYRYNYVLDNCATRPLRAIERALGDTIIMAEAAAPTTFREVMRRNHRNYPWYQFGIDLALGSGIDRSISVRERTFAPTELMVLLPTATCGGSPVVASSETWQAEDNPIEAPTPFVLSPLFVSLLVLGAAVLLTVRDIRRRRTTRWFDSALFGVFGLAGILLTYLIFVSVHEATSPNWLYVWLNPLCLVAAIGVWIKRAKSVVICYYFINFVAVLALAIAWYYLPQAGNAAFAPLIAADLLRSACYIFVNRQK